MIASILVTIALAAPEARPAAAAPFLTAVASGDLGAARALLAEEVTIMDDRAGNPVASTLEAFADYVRGCERTGLFSDVDAGPPERAAASVTWTCPSREAANASIWTEGARVVWIQFRMTPPQ